MITRALATWRLTSLVVDDEITRPIRERASGRFAYLLGCRRCMSVWAGLATLILPAWMCRVLAWSAVSILADEWRQERAAVALARRMHGGVQSGRAAEGGGVPGGAADHVGGDPDPVG